MIIQQKKKNICNGTFNTESSIQYHWMNIKKMSMKNHNIIQIKDNKHPNQHQIIMNNNQHKYNQHSFNVLNQNDCDSMEDGSNDANKYFEN